MMSFRFSLLVACLIGCQAALAADDQSKIDERLLLNRLNNLESQAVQRRGRKPTTVDLLNRQNRKIAEQVLNAQKTRNVRNRKSPRLERKLDRSRRLMDARNR